MNKEQHCQAGLSNPQDEREYAEPTEMINGKQMTKAEFILWLNEMVQPSFGTFKEDDHYDGKLYLSFPFDEEG